MPQKGQQKSWGTGGTGIGTIWEKGFWKAAWQHEHSLKPVQPASNAEDGSNDSNTCTNPDGHDETAANAAMPTMRGWANRPLHNPTPGSKPSAEVLFAEPSTVASYGIVIEAAVSIKAVQQWMLASAFNTCHAYLC